MTICRQHPGDVGSVIQRKSFLLIHDMLNLLGERTRFICPAIPRLQSEHLAWFYQLWCIHSPPHSSSELPDTHDASRLLRHFDSFPSVLRRLCRCSKSQPCRVRMICCHGHDTWHAAHERSSLMIRDMTQVCHDTRHDSCVTTSALVKRCEAY
jgi:hypothetical protein